MDFINFEAEESSGNGDTIHFSDDEETIDVHNFINDSEEITDGISFYRNLDPHNPDHYNKFSKQTRDPVSAVYDDDGMYFSEEDPQLELCAPEGMMLNLMILVGLKNQLRNFITHLRILKIVTINFLMLSFD